jgi:predicted ester cyclase
VSPDAKERIVAFYRRVFEQRDLSTVAQEVDATFVNHVAREDNRHGPEGASRTFEWLLDAFTDLELEVHHVISDGDLVTVHMTMHGTHTGPFLHLPATGKRFAWRQMHLVRHRDGVALEHWATRDDVGMMQQLGGNAGGS